MEVINKTGRRKTAVARVFLKDGNGKITVNGKELKAYFAPATLQYKVNQPLVVTETLDKFDVVSTIKGGGISGQAEALRLGIARALVANDPERTKILRQFELMTRDPRMVERKKPGQKKARKKFQFSKR